ncbi:MAG: 3-oxoacyl-ACP reductase FabG [Bacteroidota bacterium]
MKRLKEKVIIITGGANGIGRVSAERLASEGATVVVWDIDEQKCQEAVNAITSKGNKASYSVVNTTDPEATFNAAKATFEEHGSIDVLINNAGITRDATIKKMTHKEWSDVIDVNLTGVFNCTKAATPFMIEQESGRIINTSSVVGLYGNFGQANYAATKSGLIGLTKTLAKELGKYNITVNAVAPGFIATDMIKTIPEKVINMMTDKTPLRRLGTPEDIANAYLFLSSEEASFVSGTVLSVDGAISI